jgi:SAM-dependent methyltransferase
MSNRQDLNERIERERRTFGKRSFERRRSSLRQRLAHVYENPNTKRMQSQFDACVNEQVAGACVLDVGCGDGSTAERLLDFGARRVHGIDVSDDQIAAAKQRREDARLTFDVQDLHEPVPGRYDTIMGRAVLHHVDWKHVLPRLYRDNLKPGGSMVFMEPVGDGLIMRLYWRFGQDFHTADERPFRKSDLDWLRDRFDRIEIAGFNWASLPAAILSSAIFRTPDNWLLSATDRIDRWALARWRALESRGRSVVIRISKDRPSRAHTPAGK